jgi:hypothetical protein
MDMKKKVVNVRIDRILVSGLEASHRRDVEAAVKRELGLLIEQNGIPSGWSSGRTARLNPSVGTKSAPSHVGRAIARSIYHGEK